MDKLEDSADLRAEASELRRWAATLPAEARVRPLIAAERLEIAADRMDQQAVVLARYDRGQANPRLGMANLGVGHNHESEA